MSLYSRLFTRCYDPFLSRGEAAGMRAIRHEVLADADGRTLEIGAGTGLNLPFYPSTVTSLTLTDPEAAMIRALQRRARGGEGWLRIVQAPADRLPFADDSFDTVVCTLVMCTVPEMAATLREVDRVLAPDGQILFIEHVRATDARQSRWQDRLSRPWHAIGYGCHCNRDTAEAITQAGFTSATLRAEQWCGMPRILQPLIVGQSVRRPDDSESGRPATSAPRRVRPGQRDPSAPSMPQ
ncbi:class I SAM-dependent methyltransferase [Micropruina sonneratiae]|uniref:class I SAM-dependent methyltransferase n=1 Tax=Micropruina sonneratiae TaxID=2986940 RepID=UPI002226F93A|nr:class I SAM-dependent methyltransferase [Micropruina sp. KQZ13P-5]MCW3157789.1 class I SAM-dependent methyltransferase [Micropruina sp. KQZ13P-5]